MLDPVQPLEYETGLLRIEAWKSQDFNGVLQENRLFKFFICLALIFHSQLFFVGQK